MKDRTSVTPIQDVTPRPLINPPAPDWMRRGLQGDPIEVVAPKPLINPPAPDELKLRPLFSEDDMYVYHGTDKDIVGELKPSMDYDSFHSGISVTKDKSLAETYGKNVHKVLVSPKAKIIKFNDLEDKLIELGTSWEDVSMRKLNKLLKDEKIDGIDYESSGYLSEYGIRITNPKMLKIVKEKK
jgi:predicted nucleic acid-binding protein